MGATRWILYACGVVLRTCLIVVGSYSLAMFLSPVADPLTVAPAWFLLLAAFLAIGPTRRPLLRWTIGRPRDSEAPAAHGRQA